MEREPSKTLTNRERQDPHMYSKCDQEGFSCLRERTAGNTPGFPYFFMIKTNPDEILELNIPMLTQ